MNVLAINREHLLDEYHPDTQALVRRLQNSPNTPFSLIVTTGEKAVEGTDTAIALATGYKVWQATSERSLPDDIVPIGKPQEFPIFLVQDETPVDDQGGALTQAGFKVIVGSGRQSLTEAYMACLAMKKRLTNIHKPK